MTVLGAAALAVAPGTTGTANAEEYNLTWSPDVAKSWPTDKAFKAGDVLIFKYNRAAHNVVRVDEINYNDCRVPKGARVLQSGNDRVTLSKGMNYFICGVPGHCEAGMKLAVKAE